MISYYTDLKWKSGHMAYLLVHSFAVSLYLFKSCLYIRAISGTNGSSGFGSVNMEHIDKRTGKEMRENSMQNTAMHRENCTLAKTWTRPESGPHLGPY